MEIQDLWFTYLLNGQKKVEGRKCSENWGRLRAGDEIVVTSSNGREQLFLITRVTVYDDLDQYLIMEGLRNCLPGVTTLEEARQIYHQFNSPEELAQYKFLGIEMILRED